MYYLILILFLIGAYFFIEPYLLRVKTTEIHLKNLKGLRIVHLSDLHSRHFGFIEKRLLTKLNQLKPDYIFITGDSVDTRTHDLEACQNFWEALVDQHPNKVFGVLGNHEYQHPKTEEIISRLEKSGIQLLNNESVKREDLILAGVKSPHLNQDNVDQALDERVDILLAHSPEIFRKVKDKEVGLVLTGHTHGGQVSIPFLRRLVLPLKYGKKYREGLFKEQGTYLYVNRGIGTTILPIRFNAPPIISLIKIK